MYWCLLFFLISSTTQEQVRPLPDLDTFLRGVRQHLKSDRLLLSQYTYTESSTERQLDSSGGVKKSEVTVSEVYPSLEQGLTYKRMISRNGKPVSAGELEKRDRQHDRKVAERTRRLEREGIDEKARRLSKEAEEKKREDEVIDEMFRLYEISMAGREQAAGRTSIRLDFRPRRGFKPSTRGGKVLSKLAGRAWFDEEDRQLVRIEAELIEDFRLGFGILARLSKGARMAFERRRINDEIWLPATARFSGSARFLLKGMRLEALSQFSDHRKFTVRTSVSYQGAKAP